MKRIDDGHRLCNDLMNCVHERAKIEKSYAQQLTDWSKRWRQLIEKGTTASPWEAFPRTAGCAITASPGRNGGGEGSGVTPGCPLGPQVPSMAAWRRRGLRS